MLLIRKTREVILTNKHMNIFFILFYITNMYLPNLVYFSKWTVKCKDITDFRVFRLTDLTRCPMPMMSFPFFLMSLTNSMGMRPRSYASPNCLAAASSAPPNRSPCKYQQQWTTANFRSNIKVLVYFALHWWEIGRKEMFYLTTHWTHFIFGYMVSDIW